MYKIDRGGVNGWKRKLKLLNEFNKLANIEEIQRHVEVKSEVEKLR